MLADALRLTAAQRRLADRLAQVLEADTQVLGAWVAGSLGKGTGDRYSDVDVLVLAAGDPAELAARYHCDADAITGTVLALLHLGRVVSCVTPAWDRFDLTFIDARELQRHDARALACLFSRGPQPGEPAARPAPPSAFAANLSEFFRVLGLAPVGVGRGECVVMLEGIGHLRRILVDAMLEQNGVTPSERGGVLKLNPFLTETCRAGGVAAAGDERGEPARGQPRDCTHLLATGEVDGGCPRPALAGCTRGRGAPAYRRHGGRCHGAAVVSVGQALHRVAA
jgi:predicted nucleotidyltransferase